jgi:hypothetical protein
MHRPCFEPETIYCGDLPSFQLSYGRSDSLKIFNNGQIDDWVKNIKKNSIDLLILNTGPHYHGEHDITFHVNHTLHFLYLHHPNISIMFRNTVHGHPECEGKFESDPLSRDVGTDSYNWTKYLSYDWLEFYHRNLKLYDMFQTHYPQMIHINIFNATVLRVDTHADCLHYCIPGPIDQWFHFIYNALMKLPEPVELKGTGFSLLNQRISTSSSPPIANVAQISVPTFRSKFSDGTYVRTEQDIGFLIMNGTRHFVPNGNIKPSNFKEVYTLRSIWDLFAIPIGQPLDSS